MKWKQTVKVPELRSVNAKTGEQWNPRHKNTSTKSNLKNLMIYDTSLYHSLLLHQRLINTCKTIATEFYRTFIILLTNKKRKKVLHDSELSPATTAKLNNTSTRSTKWESFQYSITIKKWSREKTLQLQQLIRVNYNYLQLPVKI